MNKFDEDLYDFVIKEENFEAAFEIGNRFKIYKEKLIKNFWSKVINNLESIIKQSNDSKLKNCIVSDEDIIKTNGAISMYNAEYDSKNYENVSVSTSFFNWGEGKITNGLFFNSDEIKSINKLKIIKYCEKQYKSWNMHPDYTLTIYKFLPDNFNDYETLRKIIPAGEGLLAEEYAESLISTHLELYPLIEKFGVKF
ncbi:MAG: hypothetical protein ACR2KX_20205 [Chitinophagaceae bacterium]